MYIALYHIIKGRLKGFYKKLMLQMLMMVMMVLMMMVVMVMVDGDGGG